MKKTLRPPTMVDLLQDPTYRKYVKQIPHLPANLNAGNPWAVWAYTTEGKWRGGNFPTYADAWAVVVKAVRSPHTIRDVSIISRRKFFSTPPTLVHIIDWPFEWCPRCRRPTMFEIYRRHHALKAFSELVPDPRCYHCGQRQL